MRELPSKRNGTTYKLRVGGWKFYLRTGEYEDGTLGEIFLDTAKEGATMRGLLSAFAISVSISLQNGVPLEKLVKTFKGTRFEPAGSVEGHETITRAHSLIDLVFKVLEEAYARDGQDGGRVPPEAQGGGRRGEDGEPSPSPAELDP